MRQLWAPWRLEYVEAADEHEGCFLCGAAAAGGDEAELVVHRGERAFVLLNRYPYASGHLMVAPVRHEGEFGDLSAEEAVEIHRLAAAALGALADAMVPRWAGDTNFMPVLADVKVLPEALASTRAKLARAWPT